MRLIEQTKGQPLKWQNINWTATSGQVRRIQERIFRAALSGELVKVKYGEFRNESSGPL